MTEQQWKFEIGASVSIVAGGLLRPAKVVCRICSDDGDDESYYVEFANEKGRRFFSWIMADDLMPMLSNKPLNPGDALTSDD